VELPFRIKFSLSRKLKGYEFPAIFKRPTVVDYQYSTKLRITNFKQRFTKQKMKILTTFALIALLFFNFSCEYDLYVDSIYKPEKLIIKEVKFDELFTDSKFKKSSLKR
jgi:hypothetical protein